MSQILQLLHVLITPQQSGTESSIKSGSQPLTHISFSLHSSPSRKIRDNQEISTAPACADISSANCLRLSFFNLFAPGTSCADFCSKKKHIQQRKVAPPDDPSTHDHVGGTRHDPYCRPPAGLCSSLFHVPINRQPQRCVYFERCASSGTYQHAYAPWSAHLPSHVDCRIGFDRRRKD